MTTLDVLAFGAHPDDVELGCGGTLASLTQSGRKVGIVHMTSGEAGTRGSAAERQAEAASAAEALGVPHLEFLDFGDGSLRTSKQEEDQLITVLRRWRPEIVLAPAPQDRHPDHGRAHSLVRDACFYSGLGKRGSGDAHRPAAMFSYLQHDIAAPTFIIDVTSSWQRKMVALDAYSSQIHQPGKEQRDEPQTKISSAMFRAAVEGRARHFGQQIGVEFGEPFISHGPLAIADLFGLKPRGLR